MPSLKEYNARIKRLRNTRKMTNTMKMVAAAKLRKAREAQRAADVYAQHLDRLLAHISSGVTRARVHPLLKPHARVRRTLILAVTSDRGLCGGFNLNLARMLAQWTETHAARLGEVTLYIYGRRGTTLFRRHAAPPRTFAPEASAPSFPQSRRIGLEFQAEFLADGFDEIYIAYNHFVNAMVQRPTVERLLPLALSAPPPADNAGADYIVEPHCGALQSAILPQAVNFALYQRLLHSMASEHSARMTAMENATLNAERLIETATLLRNRARQAAITKEILEIITGAEALKG
jgi:F-type H+-transporting ATPase subunit gamma